MGVRREGREAAVQFLYQRDLNPGSGEEALRSFYEFRGISPAARKFATAIVDGVMGKAQEIDQVIEQHAENYDISRISAVDRNVLRIAIYEMLHCPDIPPVVSINEGIEIAKKYSTEESGRFVNGILDRVRKNLPRPPRESAG